jgi:hypothetical protein
MLTERRRAIKVGVIPRPPAFRANLPASEGDFTGIERAE